MVLNKKNKNKKYECVCAENHKDAEKRSSQESEMSITENVKINPYYEHIKLNPYLFCIHSQPREPNKFYKNLELKKECFLTKKS